jgi:HAD superfamily hydrolase (TIGR01662 family)
MEKRNVLICIDKDGTIEYDKHFHLGHQRNWKSKLHLLEGVANGIKRLNKIPGVRIYIITNQPGVAVKNYPLLTHDRSEEVCEYVIDRLGGYGAHIHGYEVCGKASLKYVARKEKEKAGFKFDKKLVGNFSCVKPKIGMIKNALKKEGWSLDDTQIYVIGDRRSDVKCGLNAGGYGILVPFGNRSEEVDKVRKLDSPKVYVARDFLDGCGFVTKRVR